MLLNIILTSSVVIVHIKWTNRFKDFLLDCYDASIISIHGGFLARMHTLWGHKNPELQNISHQSLRNQAAYLSKLDMNLKRFRNHCMNNAETKKSKRI